MTLKATLLEVQDIKGIIYDFPYVDDILPEHSHGPDDIHITIVARGKLIARYQGKKQIISAGDIYDWTIGEPHEFIALEANSRIINITKKYKSKE